MTRIPAVLLAVSSAFTILNRTAHARPITLPEALAMADASPGVRAALTRVDEASGNHDQASSYAYNPALEVTAGRATVSGTVFYDLQIGLSQTIELGGKRGARKRSAAFGRDAARADLEGARVGLQAEIRRAFTLAIVAQARVEVARENETAARQFQVAARERLQLGAATQTELNVASAALGRGIATSRGAERDLLLARQDLGTAVGLVGADLEPQAAMPTFPAISVSEEQLVAEALSGRRDLVAAERSTSARGADVDLADALAKPDPELSVAWARDAVDGATAVIVGVRLELPLWNRNQGNRRAARAVRTRATIEATALRTGVEREVRTAIRRYLAATAAVSSFDQQVIGSLGENLALARDSLAAGKLGLLDLNTVRRDLVESQLSYLDSIVEAVEARAALERAIGRSLQGTP